MREIINTHDQLIAFGGGVALLKAHGGIRTKYVSGVLVYRVNAKGHEVVTDPKAAWYHYHRKHFSNFLNREGTFPERQRMAEDAAKQWVAEQGWYDGPWVRNGFGDLVPEVVQKQFPLKRKRKKKV